MPITARGRRRSCWRRRLTPPRRQHQPASWVYDAHLRLAFRCQRARYGHGRFAIDFVSRQPFKFAMPYRADRRQRQVALPPSSLTLLVLNASFARRQASVAPGARCLAPVTPAAPLPSCCHFAPGRTMSVNRSFGLATVFSAQRQECLRVDCLPVRGCSGICDEQPLHIQPGHRRVASLRHRALVALAVPRQRLLLSSRHGAGQLLGRVRPAGWLPAAVALVAAVRVQLPSPHRLGASPSPHAAGMSRPVPCASTGSSRLTALPKNKTAR